MRPCLSLALIAALGAGAVLPGCARFPELDGTVSAKMRRAPYPDLVPLDGLQARINATQIEPGTLPDITARVARLKARAAHLRGTVIDNATRARMGAGVPTPVQTGAGQDAQQ